MTIVLPTGLKLAFVNQTGGDGSFESTAQTHIFLAGGGDFIAGGGAGGGECVFPEAG